MPRGRSNSFRILLGCIAFAAAACGRRVDLGAIGDGGASVLWRATFEPANLSEWSGDGNGGIYLENAATPPTVTTDVVHRGQYAGMTTITPSMGMPSLDYLYRVEPSPREAYYSAWFYIPASVTVRTWLSVSHFRCSQTGDGNNLMAIWDVNLYPRLDGTLVAHLYNYVKQTNVEQTTPVPVPVGSWVHFEVLLSKATDATGRVAVWQDDALILDASGVATTQTDWVQWDAGGALDNLSPSPALVYIDDAAISLTRLGTGQ
jgi:hypothetical protein